MVVLNSNSCLFSYRNITKNIINRKSKQYMTLILLVGLVTWILAHQSSLSINKKLMEIKSVATKSLFFSSFPPWPMEEGKEIHQILMMQCKRSLHYNHTGCHRGPVNPIKKGLPSQYHQAIRLPHYLIDQDTECMDWCFHHQIDKKAFHRKVTHMPEEDIGLVRW